MNAFGIDAFQNAGWLWLWVPLALLGAVAGALRREPALAWPAASSRDAVGRGSSLSRGLGLLLRATTLLALAGVLAGPVGRRQLPPEPGEGLDLVLTLDTSGSMRALDARIGDAWRPRLDLARAVVARFAEERAGRGDRVGLVVFAETASTQCPLTHDGGLLAAALERLRPARPGEATALGDALALAVKRAVAASGPEDARVVVLLTDGRSNAGAISVEAATALAVAEGVRVHTVAIGTAGEEVAVAGEGPAGEGLRFERHDVDLPGLRRIASRSGGRSYAARSASDLPAVYRAIDALERRARELPGRSVDSPRPEPLLALAGGSLLVEILGLRVARRRIP